MFQPKLSFLPVAVAAVCLSATPLQAVVSYWDPQGAWGSYNTYTTGALDGSWEAASWSRNTTGSPGAPADQGQTTPQLFTESDAAVFAVGAGSSNATVAGTTTFTVTATNNHTVAGFFIGALNPNSCIVTINGPGILTLPGTSGTLQGFNIANSSDSSVGNLIISNTIAGAAVLTAQGNGQIFLRGANTWTGGTSLGYSGASWSGILNFNSIASFGTGPIKLLRGYSGSAGALVVEGTSPVTITNTVDWSGALSNTPYMNIVGNPAGVTFSGPWSLGSKAVNVGSGGSGNLVIISNVITGTGSFTKYNPGTLELTSTNNIAGATTVNNGVLQLGNGTTRNGAVTNTLVTTSPGTLLIANPNAMTFAKVISGTGSLTNTSTGVQTFSAANTYSGGTTIQPGSTSKLGNNGGIGSGDLNLGGTLELAGFSPTVKSFNGAGTVANSSGTGTYTLTVGNGNTSGNFSGVISNSSGILGLTQTGTGTLVLGGTCTYNGATYVTGGGTLQYAAASAIASASSLLVPTGNTVDFQGLSGSVAALGGGGTVNNLNGTLTLNGNAALVNTQNYQGFSCLSGPINGNGTLIKAGTGAMAIRPANGVSALSGFGGTFTFNAGSLSVGGGPNMLPPSYALNVPAGALFQVDGSSQTVASLGGSGSVNLGGVLNVNGGGTFSGVIQNSELPGSSTAVGNGLRGYYYTNIDFTGLGAVRDDSTVNFPDMSFLPWYANSLSKTQQVSVRWVGQVLAPASGLYYFGTKCDDGSRLWVNGQLVIDDYTAHGATVRMGGAGVSLSANTRYDVVLEYFNNGTAGAAGFYWSPPNTVGNDPTNVVPANALLLPGAGSLVKSGSDVLQLTGANTYSGGTLVSGGGTLRAAAGSLGSGSATVASDGSTLQLDSASSLNPAADLVLQGPSANVNLAFTGTSTIHGLTFDGVNYAVAGTWGSPTSSAANKSSQFTGNGVLNVTAVGSTTALNASSLSPVYGSPLTFTATVSGAAPAPTGTVTFYDVLNYSSGTNFLGSSPLAAGTATLTVSNLQVGVLHSVYAVYNGDASHATSASSTVDVTTTAAPLNPLINIVTKVYDATTTATIASIGGTQPGDANYVFATPGYSATFATKDAGTQSVSVTSLSLAGSQSGNYTLSGSAFTTTGIITPKALKVFGITASAKVYDGTTAATINTAGGFLGVSEAVGTGTTADGTNYLGDDVSLVTAGAVGNFADPNVANNKTVTITGLSLSGAQAGDYTVTSPTATANITKGASVDAFTSSPNPSSFGAPVTLTATLSGNPGGTPTGSIIFAAGGVPFSTNALVSGVASTMTAALPLGTATLAAWYTGSTNFVGVTNTVSQVVNSTCSQTNVLLSVQDNGTTLTLRFQGTAQAQYSVLTNANVSAPIANWGTLPNTTTNLADPNGFWSITVPKNTTGQLFYRSKATSVCP